MKKVFVVSVLFVTHFLYGMNTEITEIDDRVKNIETALGYEKTNEEPHYKKLEKIINTLEDRTDPNNSTSTIIGLVTKVKNNTEAIETNAEAIEKIVNTLEDRIDPDDDTSTIIGLVTKVKNNTESIEDIRSQINTLMQSIQSVSAELSTLSSTVSDLSSQIADMKGTIADQNQKIDDITARMDAVDSHIDERMDSAWNQFVEQKFQEYMDVKKQVLDILAAEEINGNDKPEYITETAERLQGCELKVRRDTLSKILDKLNVFARLLDAGKLDTIQNYLNDTNVSDPELKTVSEVMSGVIVDGEYVKVCGATRDYTRSAGFKTGLPKQNWMDPSCDYFPYASRPTLEQTINRENLSRKANNEEIERQNALAQAAYEANIHTAERVTFPANNLTELITEYNRLLTYHEI